MIKVVVKCVDTDDVIEVSWTEHVQAVPNVGNFIRGTIIAKYDAEMGSIEERIIDAKIEKIIFASDLRSQPFVELHVKLLDKFIF